MKLKARLLYLAGVLLLAAGLPLYLNSPPSLMREEVFSVKEGESVKSAARRLKKQNLVRSETFFTLAALPVRGWGIKKGRYRIEQGLSSTGILAKMVRGRVITHKITIPEGFNLYT
ncbi:MAG TPA: hypothetical protein ENN79_04050, partial [Desulfobacteraceae bacterium]|nr:hypothetical protein [Desulfobacteraceae bacterium]